MKLTGKIRVRGQALTGKLILQAEWREGTTVHWCDARVEDLADLRLYGHVPGSGQLPANVTPIRPRVDIQALEAEVIPRG